MKHNEVDTLANYLVAKYGLPLKVPVSLSSDGHSFSLQPEGVHPNEGFQIAVRLGWRSLEIEFLAGKFSAELIEEMGTSDSERKALFGILTRQIADARGEITFKINGAPYAPSDTSKWPVNWRALEFAVRISPLDVNTEDHGRTIQLVTEWVDRVYAAIIAISPLEEGDIQKDTLGLPEGALARVEVNKYERSRLNRAICINHYGAKCQVCGLDFEERYGSIGVGFIHVHHVVPVSRLGPDYIVNPVTDLVPVCPNCHAMMHRRDIPYSVSELRSMLPGLS